jgi:hypothetical protein
MEADDDKRGKHASFGITLSNFALLHFGAIYFVYL